jgi:L-asparaginase
LKDLQFIITGGTIDGEYSFVKQTSVPRKESVIVNYIKNIVKAETPIYETVLCMVDSREMTDERRLQIIEAINASRSNNIIITHGTDTMPETARFIKQAITGDNVFNDKKIILLGAFLPLMGFCPTDAPFNLGFAIGAFDTLPAGVYIAMNMQIWNAEEVKKNFEQGRFEHV